MADDPPPGALRTGMLGFALLSPNLLIIAVSAGLAGLTTLIAVVAARQQRRRRDQLWQQRSDRYRAHLADGIRVLTESARRQLAHSEEAYPSPGTALAAVRAGTVWGRRPDGGCLVARVGTGRVAARRAPRLAGGSDPDGDPTLLAEAVAAAARHGGVDDAAITLELAGGEVVECGELRLLRAIIVGLTRAYGPDLVRIHATAAPAERRWLGALPHAGCICADARDIRAALRKQPHEPGLHHVVVLASNGSGDPREVPNLLNVGPDRLLSVVTLGASGERLPEGVLITRPGSTPIVVPVARADAVTHPVAVAFAEGLRRLSRATAHDPVATPIHAADLLQGAPEHPLILPIGLDDDGAPIAIDLREAARGGDGPHGLIVGATGRARASSCERCCSPPYTSHRRRSSR